MTEAWLPIVGYEGVYEVSNYGRVRRVAPRTGGAPGVLAIRRDKKGYIRVALHNGYRRDYGVHRLVAIAFISPAPSPRHEVNHRDGVKSNNCLANLEWATPEENARHAVATGLRPPLPGEKNGRAKLTEADVAEIRRLRGKLTQREVGIRYGVSNQLVSQIQLGQVWVHSSDWDSGEIATMLARRLA